MDADQDTSGAATSSPPSPRVRPRPGRQVKTAEPRSERGQIAPDTDGHRVLMMATAPLYHLRVLLEEPISQEETDA